MNIWHLARLVKIQLFNFLKSDNLGSGSMDQLVEKSFQSVKIIFWSKFSRDRDKVYMQ